MTWHTNTSTVQLLWILQMLNFDRHVTAWTIAAQATEPMAMQEVTMVLAAILVRLLFVPIAVVRCVAAISYLALVADNERL